MISNDEGFALCISQFSGVTLLSPFPSESARASQIECYCHCYNLNFTGGGAKDKVAVLCQRSVIISCCDSGIFWSPAPPLSLHPPCVLVLRSGFLILGSAMCYFTQQYFCFRDLSGGIFIFSESLNLAKT